LTVDFGTPIPEDLLSRVLRPYMPGCKYLKRAWCALPEPGTDHLVRLTGELGIESSCYIEDTGHFNAVEFNISFNQLIYTLLGYCVTENILPVFESMSFEEFLARQLPDVLIHKFGSKFRRPMNSRSYRGFVEITDAVDRGPFIIVNTICRFEDDAGGNSHGEVRLAILNGPVSVDERGSGRS
jgi:hypothetical protein